MEAGGLRLFEVCLRVCGNLIYMCFRHIIILYVITTYKTYCVLEQTRDRPQTEHPLLRHDITDMGAFSRLQLELHQRETETRSTDDAEADQAAAAPPALLTC